MWWHRHSSVEWLAPCRDLARRRQRVVVALTDDDRIAVVLPCGDAAIFEPLQVGQLRGRLLDAIWHLEDRLADKRKHREERCDQ